MPSDAQDRRTKRSKWAYMRVGYKTGMRGGGRQSGGPKKKPVYKWVRVGSSFFKQLSRKGVTPTQFRTSRTRPSMDVRRTQTIGSSPDTRDRVARSKAQQRRDRQAANRAARGAARRVAGGAGGGGGARGGVKGRRGKGGGNKAKATWNYAGKQIGSPSTGRRLGSSFADSLAGQQFDPQIRALETIISRLGPQSAQNQHDLDQWYGEAGRLNEQAGVRNAGVTDSLASAQEAATARILESLGGGANAAGGVLGAQGLDQAALMRAQGAADEQSHNDLTGILAQEAAGAKRAEQARQTLSMQDYQLQLSDLMGQRGQAKANALMEIQRYNNEVGQQRFANQISKMQAQAGVAGLGLDLAMKQQQLAAAKQESGGGPSFLPWKRLPSAEKYNLLNSAVYTPAGRKRSRVQAEQYLRGLGYSPRGNFDIRKALGSYF